MPSHPEPDDDDDEQPVDEVYTNASPSERPETRDVEDKDEEEEEIEESLFVSTKETIQGSCCWESCVVIVAVVMAALPPLLPPPTGTDTLIRDTADVGAASHMPRPKSTGYRRLRKRFFHPRCLT